ncbi:hypothetical protein DVU_3122 [Nitratidesulfovibrio vulgaris str. Hildenborough]|uniref:Uncharacterized protein n=1 Tax=Nitratidesulfovibrio vulgaris (strain ATCC 29579 / DSM 644 / CCUG 34227 / NCIMB 8303 / VKM B-1760 / Hildenborough) TaxID=882 RepID=Q726I5_NITV2|nr:hypothetical protein DVU_3122 [Nitratidesulfovibrio vulgaris str. Hildenborough]
MHALAGMALRLACMSGGILLDIRNRLAYCHDFLLC